MADRKRKWRLVDLVDFEARLPGAMPGDTAKERRRYRREVGRLKGWPEGEGEKRRLGLWVWLVAGREDGREGPGHRLVGAVRLAGIVLGVLAVLGGIGLMRGMLKSNEFDLFTRGFNVWVFLGLALGVQWLLLLGGLLGYAFLRREKGSLSIFQRFASRLALAFAGSGKRSLTKNLLEGGSGYRSVFSWRLARLTQGVAVMFNVGLLAGFYGCLLFFSVGFYWESTFAGSEWGMLRILDVLGTPWAGTGLAPPPVSEGIGSLGGQVSYSVIDKLWYEKADTGRMWPFLMMSLVVYGLLPRVLLWVLCGLKERRALATLPFQAPRHRELWRRLTKVERTLASAGQADGAVLVDVGGIEVATERLREFLLRELRVNPRERFTAGVLDEEREQEALAAIREADLGVVFLVEGWALSPKQMRVLYERVRAMGGPDIPVNFLVIGELRGGEPSPPEEEEWMQWKAFVDSLRDPACEVVAFASPATVGGER